MVKIVAKGINYLLGSYLHKKKVYVNSSLDFLQRERVVDKNYLDYIRLSSLELVSFEIKNKNLQGNVAELGVYKGKFARYINQYFPDRTLYLFDTFEGFHESDVEKEKQNNYSSGEQSFTDTSVEKVLALMPHPGQCKPVKGFFPASAKGIDDTFVFVSLDADLYDPLYSGLQFFYPKLVKGGYIFIHDFNNDGYKGARKAVETFCKEEGINFLPLPDSGGSAVIIK
jgi:O-methyltransferase